MSETRATVLVPDRVVLPQSCDLFLKADGTVGRHCYVVRQANDKAELAFMGRIGPDAKADKKVFAL